MGANEFEVNVGPGRVRIELDHKLSVTALAGSEDPIAGWVSRGYHRKAKSTTLIGRCAIEGRTSLVCRIAIGEPITRSQPASGDRTYASCAK